MTQEELHKLHRVILIIADEIKRVCEKNNIQYSLDGGSLIGAVRHKGFIPWDDDLDVDMTREDYEKFISVCQTDLGEAFSLLTWENDPEYPKGFCKILLKDTKVVEKECVNTRYKQGIYVDIFPWDNVPKNRCLEKIQQFRIYYYKKILHMHSNCDVPHGSGMLKKAVFGLIKICSKLYTHEKLVKNFTKELMRYDKSAYVSCMVGVYGYKRTKISSEIFSEYISMQFEDRTYDTIKEYHQLLTKIYGDYMKIPPVEERRIHDFVELDFGPYLTIDV